MMLSKRLLAILSAVIIVAGCGELAARNAASDREERSRDDDKQGKRDVGEHFACRLLAVVDTVLEHDVDPPTRQQMVLEGVKALFTKSGKPIPAGLSRRLSDLASSDAIEHLLRESWGEDIDFDGPDGKSLEAAMIEGVVATMPESGRFIPPEEFKVHEQTRTKGYVGIGIALAIDLETDKRIPIILDVRPGPALRAGAKAGDLILAIDGTNTKSTGLQDLVRLLRGEEGSVVTIRVRQKGSSEERALTITRGLAPIPTVLGYRRISEAAWDFRADGHQQIGYLSFRGIREKTIHELREAAALLEQQGCRALVLDLRSGGGGFGAHPAVLLADTLLDGGPIGRLQTPDGAWKRYQASVETLFRDWPMVVLVNRFTRSESEFLAAALQDHGRAVLVGERTAGDGYQHTVVPLPDGRGGLALRTALLYRGDGTPLLRNDAEASSRSRTIVMRRNPGRFRADSRENLSGEWGVVPDHSVAISNNQLRDLFKSQRERETFNPSASETVDEAVDPQLEKAIELLQSRLESEAE